MFVHAVKMAPRWVMNLVVAVVLCLAVLVVAAVSVLGFTLVVQGWATNPPTTIHAPSR